MSKRELLPLSKGMVDESVYDMEEEPQPITKPYKPEIKPYQPKTSKTKPSKVHNNTKKKNIQIPVKSEHYELWKDWDSPDKVRIVKSFILERLDII